jgi:hypothetical protein
MHGQQNIKLHTNQNKDSNVGPSATLTGTIHNIFLTILLRFYFRLSEFHAFRVGLLTEIGTEQAAE